MSTVATSETPEALDIIDRALKLSAAERDLIAQRLRDSVDPPPHPYESADALRAELQRRIEAVENGTMKTYTLEEAMAKIRQDREGRPS